jgi:hypothetical protein
MFLPCVINTEKLSKTLITTECRVQTKDSDKEDICTNLYSFVCIDLLVFYVYLTFIQDVCGVIMIPSIS